MYRRYFYRYSVHINDVFHIIIKLSIQPNEICDVERSFPCINFPLPNQSLTWIVSLFHIHCKDCVIIMLITIKTLFYSANAYENGFLNVFSTGNLLNSCVLWQSRACAERKCAVYMSTNVFNTIHCKRHRFLSFFECILSKTYRNEYRMKKNGHTGSDIDACWPV